MAHPETPELPKLTIKQQRFIEAYCGAARFNASEAARLAGYSEKSAAKQGHDLKKTPHIRARIDELLQERTLSAPEVLRELTDIASAEWRDFITVLEFDDDGNPVRVKMDLKSKVDSLELLGKHYSLFTDNIALSGGIDIQIVGVDTEKL